MKQNLILLICFVNKKKLLDEILARLIELGVGGATVLDSTGVGRSKVDDVVLYQGFKDVLLGTQKDHYTILCIIKKNKMNDIAQELTKLYGDFKEKGIGFFFTVSLENVWGINLPEE